MENPENVENLDLMQRLERMSKLNDVVFGKKKQKEAPRSEEDSGPRAMDIGTNLEIFEKTLERCFIEVAGDDQKKREFNLTLDSKLAEYRARAEKNNSNPDSEKYKDALYKLMIGSDLRNFGSIKLEEVFKKNRKYCRGG